MKRTIAGILWIMAAISLIGAGLSYGDTTPGDPISMAGSSSCTGSTCSVSDYKPASQETAEQNSETETVASGGTPYVEVRFTEKTTEDSEDYSYEYEGDTPYLAGNYANQDFSASENHFEQVEIQPVNPYTIYRINAVLAQMTLQDTFRVGYSAAMDKEIHQLVGLQVPAGWLSQAPSQMMAVPTIQDSTSTSSYDWRSIGNGLPPVKNQSSCGSCWAFGTVGLLEAQIVQKCGTTVDLSEEYLVDCNMEGWSCNGGWWAHDYHMTRAVTGEVPGAVLETSDPYSASSGVCGGPYQHPYKIYNWAYVTGQPIPTVQAIKAAISKYGPIAAAVYVGPKFQAYTGGIFNANETGSVNHAINIVGWVDDLGTDNGYWILRNSWGTSWGEQGYMRIRYGMNSVGYAANYVEFTCPTSPDTTPPPTPDPVIMKAELNGSFQSITNKTNGRSVKASLRAANSGNVKAGRFKVTYYLSNDGVAKKSVLGTATVKSGLEVGSTIGINISVSFAKSARGKYLLAVIDSDGVIPELDETNNTVTAKIP
jgi:C1A family cysteine protease